MIDTDKIKILKNNRVYRISDVFYERGDETPPQWERNQALILSDPQYEGTILRDYLTRKKKHKDFSCWRDVVREHAKKNSYEVANRFDLVVHMRLGDVMVIPKAIKVRNVISAYDNFYDKVDIDGLDISRVVVVTAMHFGADETTGRFFYSDEAKDKSVEVFRSLEEQTRGIGLPFELVSNDNIDADIAFMSYSSYFVRGRTMLSRLVGYCVESRKNSKQWIL
jgi:hypothetical protein